MSITLYDAVIPSYLQILGAVRDLVAKAESFCDANGFPHEELVLARLAPDMASFNYQVKSTVTHSIGAIDGVRLGAFSPDLSAPPTTFAELLASVDGGLERLNAIQPAEVNGFVGQDMAFVMGEMRLPFDAERFLFSFSLPNFYFHATTAYDLLRAKGVEIGKIDFLGRLQVKR